LATLARADETVLRSFETSAAPLQCYRALSEEWIYTQWNPVKTVALGKAPETIWRVTLEDGTIEEGIMRVMQPGVVLEYSYFGEYEIEVVHFDFLPNNGGTTVKLTHTIPGSGGRPLKSAMVAGETWEARFRHLKAYLDQRANSYLAAPRGDGSYPAVLLLHDRFGLTTNLRDIADSLALRGYVVLAVDMFRGDRTSDITQASNYIALVQEDNALMSIGAAWRWLLASSNVNSQKIGVMGIGYGGNMAIRTLAAESSLRAAVAWYPDQAPPDSLLTRIASPLMIIHAAPALDKPTPQAETMSQRLVQNGVRAETLLIKGDAGFASPSNGAAYSAAATADAFRTTLGFLDRRLKL